ncbi:hypothetical protein [Streptomyces parvulus]|nr:hypothetical protein [Streptomyces parvulus]
MALMAGIGIGVLTFLAQESWPTAIIAGIGAAAGCTAGLHNLID